MHPPRRCTGPIGVLLIAVATAHCSSRPPQVEETPEPLSVGGVNLELRRCRLLPAPPPIERVPVNPGDRIRLGPHEIRFGSNVPEGTLLTLTAAENQRVGFRLALERNERPVQFTDSVEIRLNMRYCLPIDDATWSIWRITPDSAVPLPTTQVSRIAIARTDRHSGFVLARERQ